MAPESQPDNVAHMSWRERALAGVLFVLMGGCLLSMIWPMYPVHGPRRRPPCRNYLKRIGLALHNYHDTYLSFPPAYTVDANGKRMHSWRVLILPFLADDKNNLQQLYDDYRMNEHWDSPHNASLINRLPTDIYHCDRDTREPRFTSYVAVVGARTVWPGADGVPIKDIKDGTTNTLLVVEHTGGDIVWTEPRDLDYESLPLKINPTDATGISSEHPEGANTLFCDGTVRFLDEKIESNTLRKLLERDDGEGLDEF